MPFFIGLVFLWTLSFSAIDSYQFHMRFEAAGVEAPATITNREMRIRRDSDGDTHRSYYLTIRFTTEDAEVQQVTKKVRETRFNSSRNGHSLSIWYLPDQPEIIALSQDENLHKARGSALIALIALFVTATLGYRAIWMARDGITARQHGLAMTAKVLNVEQTQSQSQVRIMGVSLQSRRYYRVIWVDSTARHGHSLPAPKSCFKGLAAGDKIRVYQGAQGTWWDGDVGARV